VLKAKTPQGNKTLRRHPMLFKKITWNGADRVFSLFQNVSGSSISAGANVCLDTSTFDGVRITTPTTATLSLYAGSAAQTIANNDFGLVQVYGYGSASVTNSTNQAIAAGDILVPVNAATYLARSAASTGTSGFVVAGAAVSTATTPAAASVAVFLRAM
jgi:hypothetical protein